MPSQIKIDQTPFSLFAYFRRTLSSKDLLRSRTSGEQRQSLLFDLKVVDSSFTAAGEDKAAGKHFSIT